MIDRIAPDVVTMDVRLPGMQGLEATRHIMSLRPTPIVVVSGIGSEDVSLTMQALKAGALSVVEKPPASTHQSYEAMASRLCGQLAIMSEVRVVRQRPRPSLRLYKSELRSGPAFYRALGVATSTGGPGALMELFAGLGREFSLPVAVVQHMTPNFMDGFATWLASVSPMPVEVVENRTLMINGHAYLAPCHRHLLVDGAFLMLDDGIPVGSHRPSADKLFSSMAQSLGPSAIGVLLTGMGEDGAAGLKQLHDSGGYTIAEDETSAVVYGMPAAAVRLGAVIESLPLAEIGARVRELVTYRSEVA
jgi:two-component system chemotaxis response regulator CheB